MKQYLLIIFLLFLASTAAAKEEDFDLVGQLRIEHIAEGIDRTSVINSVYFGLYGFSRPVPLSVANLDKILLEHLAAANGKWVGLCGVWEQQQDMNAAFRPSSVTVLGDGFQLVGQIIKFTHPDGSMVGIKYAIVDSHGLVFPLRFVKDIPADDPPLNRRLRVRGSFQTDGHKNLLMSFEVEKIEEIPNKRDAGEGK